MTINIGPGRIYVAPVGTPVPASSLFIAPLPPRKWSWAWLKAKFRRRTLGPEWVPIGYTNEGVNFTYSEDLR